MISGLIFIQLYFLSSLLCFVAVERPSLSKFHRNRVHRAHLHVDRSFHSLVTLQWLFTWRLGPEPFEEALAHELTIRRHEFSLYLEILYILFNLYLHMYTHIYFIIITIYLFINTFMFSLLRMATMKGNKGKGVVDEATRPGAQS